MFRTGTHAHGRSTTRQASLTSSCTVRRVRARIGHEDGDAGFTMIEAVVSFVIFAIVIAAAVLAIVAGITTSNSNRDRVTAANVAQQVLNNSQVIPVASLTASAGPSAMPTATSTITRTVGNEPYTAIRRVDFVQGSATATATSGATGCPTAAATTTTGPGHWMHINVTVTWPGANGRNVQMDTVRSC